MQIRRVIVGTGSDGKAQVLSDDSAPRAIDFKQVPGFSPTLLWTTPALPEVGKGSVSDPTPTAESWVPGPGGTCLMTVRFPPDSVMMRADFDPAAFGAEFGAGMPGLAEKFEMDSPGMHTTDSVDYDVVLEGEITLELDDGKEVLPQEERRRGPERQPPCVAQQGNGACVNAVRPDRREAQGLMNP